MDLNARLIVRRRREHLTLRGRDGCVAVDDFRADAAERLNAERERGHVEQEHVLDLADEHAALNRCADGDAFVRVDALRRLFAEDLADCFLYRGDTGRPADENNLVDVAAREPCILHRFARRHHRTLDEVCREFFKFCTREREVEMLWSRGIRRDKRQVDIRLGHTREFDLCLLCRLDETLCAHLVLRKINAVDFLELLDHPVHNLLIEIVAAEVGIAVCCLDLEHAFAEFEDGDIECAAAKVEDENSLVLILIQTVGERRRGGFVDDAQDFETCDLARVLRRLTLTVVEIRGHRNNRLRHRLTEICFGITLKLLQNHR